MDALTQKTHSKHCIVDVIEIFISVISCNLKGKEIHSHIILISVVFVYITDNKIGKGRCGVVLQRRINLEKLAMRRLKRPVHSRQ